MFGQMMDAIDDDYLRYVMHVQVVTGSRGRARLHHGQLHGGRGSLRRAEPARRLPGHRPRGRGGHGRRRRGAGGVGAGGQYANGAQAMPQHMEHMEEVLQPVVKSPEPEAGPQRTVLVRER